MIQFTSFSDEATSKDTLIDKSSLYSVPNLNCPNMLKNSCCAESETFLAIVSALVNHADVPGEAPRLEMDRTTTA